MTSFEASLRALQVGSTFPHADLIGLAWANDGAWTVLRLAHAETSLDFTADRAPCRAYAFFLRQEGDSTPWGVVAAFSKEGSWMHAPRADGVPTLVTWPVRANADASRLELEASFVDAVDARSALLWIRERSWSDGCLCAMEYGYRCDGDELVEILSVCGADPASYADKGPEFNQARAREVETSYEAGFVGNEHPRPFRVRSRYRGGHLEFSYVLDPSTRTYVWRR